MRPSRAFLLAAPFALACAPAWPSCKVDPSLYHAYDASRPTMVPTGIKKVVAAAAQGTKPLPAPPQREQDMSPERRRWQDMLGAVQHHDLQAFKGLLPADPAQRKQLLLAQRWLATAAGMAALDIMAQILAWHPELAREPDPHAAFTPALVELTRGWKDDEGPGSADRVEAMRALLQWGAKPDGMPWGSPLVLLAAMAPSEQTARAAQLLVQAGASNAGWNGTTPLRKAAEAANADVAAALLRLPLSQAELDDALVRTPVQGGNTVLPLLLARGADPNTTARVPASNSAAPYPALQLTAYEAVRTGDPSIVKLMLQYRADPNRIDGDRSALMAAVHDATITRLLLEAGADPNWRSRDGRNALMMTRTGDEESIRLLFERGAQMDVDRVSWGDGRAPEVPVGPVVWALIRGNDSLAAMLVARAPLQARDCGAPYYAAQAGAVATLRALLQRSVSLRDVTDDGERTPFAVAASEGKLEAVRFLLDRGVAKADEATPRRLAIGSTGGHPRFPELVMVGGEKVLDLARRARQDAVVEELIRRGAR